MAEVIKQMHDGPEEGKANAKVVAQFETTREDENGNLIAEGRNLPKEGKANAKVVKQFDGSIDHGTYIETVPKPDFAK